MANWIRLAEAAYRFKIPLESLCNLVGLKAIPKEQLDSYWLLVESSNRQGAGKREKKGKPGEVSTRILYVLRSDDIYSEDEPDMLLDIFSSLRQATPLFKRIILECYLNLSKERSRNIFRRLSLGENIYTLMEETGLTRAEIYKRYDAAVKELLRKEDEVIDNLRLKYMLTEKIGQLEKENHWLVKNKDSCHNKGSYTVGTTAGKILPSPNLQKLSLTFTGIGLSYPIRKMLIENGIETIPELLGRIKAFGPGYLLTFRYFGKRSLNTLKEKLLAAGLVDEAFGSVYFEYVD